MIAASSSCSAKGGGWRRVMATCRLWVPREPSRHASGYSDRVGYTSAGCRLSLSLCRWHTEHIY
jgi:hypothetical protein